MSRADRDTSEYHRGRSFGETFFATEGAPLHYSFGAASHVGHVRSRNEDHYAVVHQRRTAEAMLASLDPAEFRITDTSTYALAVADGMGGMKSGELASRIALQTMLELSSHATSWVMKLTDADAQQIQQRVEAYVERVHERLQQEARSDPARDKMGTTWTSAHLISRRAVIVHLGDSRAYLFRDGVLRQLTRDQTMAQALIDVGMEPESVSKFRHVLVNSFGGGGEAAEATIYHERLEPGDRLLLCTDGLSDMLSDDQLVPLLQRHPNPQACCDQLVQQALARGGKDNVTVVLAAAAMGAVD